MSVSRTDITEKVKQYIVDNKMISEGDTVIVGLSGGADSVCLLKILNELKEEWKINLIAVHVHHGIRGKEADEDEEFVKELCDDVSLFVYRRNIPELCKESHESEEECGRRVRYEIFGELSRKYDNAKIAVAHHMNDQAETILFRMARGTGIRGIRGMLPVSGNIIRPLLAITREEILSYLSLINQPYRSDYTNEDTDYSRNYIRKEIVPRINEINPGFVRHMTLLGNEVAQLEDYMEEKAEELLSRAFIETTAEYEHGKYNVNVLSGEAAIVRAYAFRRMMRQADISLKDVSREHVERIDGLLLGREARQICLPRGIRFVREADYIAISCKNSDDNKSFCIDLEELLTGDIKSDEKSCLLPEGGMLTCRIINDFRYEEIPDGIYTKWFDYDKIINGLCVRTRSDGDYLIVNSQGNHKKLKDYMINEKIPKSERDRIPLIANGDRIAWVIGHRMSGDVMVTGNTRTVLEITYNRE